MVVVSVDVFFGALFVLWLSRILAVHSNVIVPFPGGNNDNGHDQVYHEHDEVDENDGRFADYAHLWTNDSEDCNGGQGELDGDG